MLKKRHWKLILYDELCLIKENVEDVPNSDVADINLTKLKKEPPSSQDEPLKISVQETCFKWITFVKYVIFTFTMMLLLNSVIKKNLSDSLFILI